jgi:hypothetical protein
VLTYKVIKISVETKKSEKKTKLFRIAENTVTECSAKRRDQRQTANRSSPLVGESVQRRKKEEIAYHIDEDE